MNDLVFQYVFTMSCCTQTQDCAKYGSVPGFIIQTQTKCKS